ncbi:antibiotic biosynthesis monooxygenase family protein [Bacillus cereus]|uniref:antibiotic biosynthesis monooxygenase family protein n=1 Tax=Bacillus cereus TaxID=1396 RepID=UPI00268BA0D3
MNTYYAAIFTSQRSEHNSERYESMSENLVELVKTQPGLLGLRAQEITKSMVLHFLIGNP